MPRRSAISEQHTQRSTMRGVDDIVIVGAGLAGLFCALKLAPRAVTVLATAPIGEGASSGWAQGGIAAALSEGDTIESHVSDTVAAGAGLVDEGIARLMAQEAAARIADLLQLGVPFDRDLQGKLVMSQEAAHSQRRIVRVNGDMAGKAIMAALITAVRSTSSIRVLENWTAEALTHEGRRITGVIARTEQGLMQVPARAVVLATGGLGGLYALTTNPPEARGNGIAMAAEAGAVIADAEFVQFHPTALALGLDPAPLATEALRGEGATLVNNEGERFMRSLHPGGDLAPRDVVARGVFAEIRAGRTPYLNCQSVPELEQRFPKVVAAAKAAGLDATRDLLPVAPAAHYHMGGILTDACGRTSLDGLWAAGECASTGIHGANRLASNSLLEAVVFAARIAHDIRKVLPQAQIAPPAAASWPRGANDCEPPVAVVQKLRQVMTEHVGVSRTQQGLQQAIRELKRLEMDSYGSLQLANMIVTARFVVAGAWARLESRGGHYRADYPQQRQEWHHRTFMDKKQMEAVLKEALEKPQLRILSA